MNGPTGTMKKITNKLLTIAALGVVGAVNATAAVSSEIAAALSQGTEDITAIAGSGKLWVGAGMALSALVTVWVWSKRVPRKA